MKKALIITVFSLSLALSFTAFNMESPTQSLKVVDEGIEQIQEPVEEPTDESNESEEAGLVYINTEMDIFLFIVESGWYYENYNNMVVFYNTYSSNPYNSIAISSYDYPVSEENRISQTELYIGQAVNNLEQIAENIEVTRTEDFIFGENSAYRYYYTGHLISEDITIEGEYMYWWIGDREYTCSLFCTTDQYKDFSNIMHDMLNNFQQPSTME